MKDKRLEISVIQHCDTVTRVIHYVSTEAKAVAFTVSLIGQFPVKNIQ